jgi:hypothetical protein
VGALSGIHNGLIAIARPLKVGSNATTVDIVDAASGRFLRTFELFLSSPVVGPLVLTDLGLIVPTEGAMVVVDIETGVRIGDLRLSSPGRVALRSWSDGSISYVNALSAGRGLVVLPTDPHKSIAAACALVDRTAIERVERTLLAGRSSPCRKA